MIPPAIICFYYEGLMMVKQATRCCFSNLLLLVATVTPFSESDDGSRFSASPLSVISVTLFKHTPAGIISQSALFIHSAFTQDIHL